MEEIFFPYPKLLLFHKFCRRNPFETVIKTMNVIYAADDFYEG